MKKLTPIYVCLDVIKRELSNTAAKNDGFLGGAGGTIYFLFYYSRVFRSPDIFEEATTQLNSYIKKLNDNQLRVAPYSLCNGLAGVGYLLNHLAILDFVKFDANKELKQLDKLLFQFSLGLIERNNTDFLHGAIGILWYFLKKERSFQTDSYIINITQSICEKIEHFGRITLLKNTSVPASGENFSNYSLSHGLSGSLIVLLECLRRLPKRKFAEHQISTSTYNLISMYEMRVQKSASIFPIGTNTDTGESTFSDRLAWCYGDVNILLLFYRYSSYFGAEKVGDFPIEKVKQSITKRLSVESTMVKDSHFCHGASGLAQFFLTLFRESHYKPFFDLYNYWINQIQRNLLIEIKDGLYGSNPHSILDGLTGIGLTLLSSYSRKPLKWSDCLLL